MLRDIYLFEPIIRLVGVKVDAKVVGTVARGSDTAIRGISRPFDSTTRTSSALRSVDA